MERLDGKMKMPAPQTALAFSRWLDQFLFRYQQHIAMPVQAVQFVFSLDRLTRTVNPSHLEAVAKRLCDGFDRSIILATVADDGDQIRHLVTMLFRDGPNQNGKIIPGDDNIRWPQAKHQALILGGVDQVQALRPAVVESWQG